MILKIQRTVKPTPSMKQLHVSHWKAYKLKFLYKYLTFRKGET